jgi:Cu/Ag efflux protein CusF
MLTAAGEPNRKLLKQGESPMMKTRAGLGWTAMIVLGLGGLNLAAAQGAEEKSEETQTKVGVVKKVDVEAKKIVVLVARELTFTVTEKTKIHKGDDAKKLADIKAGANVKVVYARSGDNRIAKDIAILAGDQKSEPTQTKVGVVRKVDVEGKKIVAMVARELTFTLTEKTKIHRGGDAKKLAEIEVGADVRVEYTRSGDNRVAKDIAVLTGDEKK